ncbi:hypothetical protein B5M42_021310 [Paenibacillus athensensis]|nr:hypothetical protein [Paenibacillus athensensis]
MHLRRSGAQPENDTCCRSVCAHVGQTVYRDDSDQRPAQEH